MVVENDQSVGYLFGGFCTCPNGKVYPVANVEYDYLDVCDSLACVNGISGPCQRQKSSFWNRRKVTCDIGSKLLKSKAKNKLGKYLAFSNTFVLLLQILDV